MPRQSCRVDPVPRPTPPPQRRSAPTQSLTPTPMVSTGSLSRRRCPLTGRRRPVGWPGGYPNSRAALTAMRARSTVKNGNVVCRGFVPADRDRPGTVKPDSSGVRCTPAESQSIPFFAFPVLHHRVCCCSDKGDVVAVVLPPSFCCTTLCDPTRYHCGARPAIPGAARLTSAEWRNACICRAVRGPHELAGLLPGRPLRAGSGCPRAGRGPTG